MSLTGNENHDISLAEAAELTANFRNSNPPGTILGFYYGKNAVQQILNQPNCVGIRIYNAKDNSNVQKLVIVGVDANGDDLTNGRIAEFGHPCPNMCSKPNQLNS